MPHACTYVLLAGLPGTGKSTLATKLAKHLDSSVILNKDTVRAALFPGKATDYSEAQNNLCMEAMLSSAAYLCETTRYIFFDGRTFSRSVHIARIIESAEANQATWKILYLWCAEDVAIARLARGGASHPAKDRDASLYRALKARFEAIEHPHLSVDTGRSMKDSVETCLHYLENTSA